MNNTSMYLCVSAPLTRTQLLSLKTEMKVSENLSGETGKRS